MTTNAIKIQSLTKKYDNGHIALNNVSFNIHKGEIFALLGPNGAGKTTLISTICGTVHASSGTVHIGTHHWVTDYRAARRAIGLVPQELALSAFETVWATVTFSRGLFGKPANNAYIEQLLKDLSLWDKRNAPIMALSGGMKRRVLIAKALSHEPEILFLDEPTAGVDVELRKSMWELIRKLQQRGVTIILTTHYIEEAEEMADRIGIINKGTLMMVESKSTLMSRLGQKTLDVHLKEPCATLPSTLPQAQLSEDGRTLSLTYNEGFSVEEALTTLTKEGLHYSDITTKQSSLEDIFVTLIQEQENAA